MSKQNILSIAVLSPLRKLLDYLPPLDSDLSNLLPGMRVLVPLQNRHIIGVIIDCKKESDLVLKKLKPISEVIDDAPIFDQDVFELCQWAANYYHASLGDILMSALPKALRHGKFIKKKKPKIEPIVERQAALELMPQQGEALNAILKSLNSFQTFLLEGVTGSGKTEVYLQAIAKVIADEKQALVLVPEISLTPQTIARFKQRFHENVVAMHSRLSEGERAQAWLAAKTGEAKIVIGTRSAVFAPFQCLGLIIVDEEHDASFKQQDRARYHARDLAIMRAKLNDIPIVLGSATPSIETYLNAERERYVSLQMTERVGESCLPKYELIDLAKYPAENGLAKPMHDAINRHLNDNNQVLIFLNRRGFAPVMYCVSCHHVMECKRCDARLVLHNHPQRLQCHHCDKYYAIPETCLMCNDKNLEPIGVGTQRLEEHLQLAFASTPIIRIDRDNTKGKGKMDELLVQMKEHSSAILLGTQMIAKGHHFPGVTLTCIVDIDSALLSTNFRAIEQLSQLIIQVGGRAGRAKKAGQVLLQTYNPQHPFLTTLLHEGYPQLIKTILQERQQTLLPPFAFCALFKAEAYDVTYAKNFLQQIKDQAMHAKEINLHGPFIPLLTRKKGLYAMHLLIKTNQRKTLHQFLKRILPQLEKSKTQIAKWSLDVDPLEF